jgi:hypothetical protein
MVFSPKPIVPTNQTHIKEQSTVFLINETQKCQGHQNPGKAEKLSQPEEL